MSFIRNHVEQLVEIRLSIISFMVDWYNKLLLKYDHVGMEEQNVAKSIVLYCIGEIEKGSFVLDNNDFYENSLISILFDLAPISKEEIRLFISGKLLSSPNLFVNVKADHRVQHGQVINVLDMLKEIGISQVNLVIEKTSQYRFCRESSKR